jgi:hypothetical protein
MSPAQQEILFKAIDQSFQLQLVQQPGSIENAYEEMKHLKKCIVQKRL